MTPQEFIRKWKPVALTERAAAHSHFIDLCKMLGHEDPVTADPTGQEFAFEKGATKTGGGEGFADVWKRGHFAWEYKKKKRNLDDALAQLVRYAAALENPPLQVACDTDRFLVRTAWTNAVPVTHELALDDLADPQKLDILRSLFFDPEKLRPKETRAGITKEAADKFSTISLRLHGRGSPEEVAHFVNQLVFCFFANSVKLLPEGFFPRLLKRAAGRPERAEDYFNQLFDAMENGGEFDLTDIAWFNGGLFDGRRALPLDSGDLGLLQAAASLDWSQIDPTIFGTLFERFLDPDKRAQIGAHYTDSEKIMMIVEPVILRPLREEWALARAEIEEILSEAQKKLPKTFGRGADKAIASAMAGPVAKAEAVRSRFTERLRRVTILDPACGSGNFLYLALQGVKDLELRANLECESLGLPAHAAVIGPEIVHGIEINPLAAELARTTIWIGDIQWRLRNGIHAKPQPILRKLDAIECRDALITQVSSTSSPPGLTRGSISSSEKMDGRVKPGHDEGEGIGRSGWSRTPDPLPASGERETVCYVEASWPAAEFIVGNPPFLGSKYFRKGRPPRKGRLASKGLGDTYTDALYAMFDNRVPQSADLCNYWFLKSFAALLEGSSFGLVATKSVAKGTNNEVLRTISASDSLIFEAWTNEPWIIDGAQVRVALICVAPAKARSQIVRLNGDSVERINSDLTAGLDAGLARPLIQNSKLAFQGVKLNGPFEITEELARLMVAEPLNVNGYPNNRVIRRF